MGRQQCIYYNRLLVCSCRRALSRFKLISKSRQTNIPNSSSATHAGKQQELIERKDCANNYTRSFVHQDCLFLCNSSWSSKQADVKKPSSTENQSITAATKNTLSISRGRPKVLLLSHLLETSLNGFRAPSFSQVVA